MFYGSLLRLENEAWGFRRGTGYSRSDFEFQLYNLLACCVSACKLIKVSETKNRKCWVSPFKSCHNTEKFYSGFNMTREENSVQIISKG